MSTDVKIKNRTQFLNDFHENVLSSLTKTRKTSCNGWRCTPTNTQIHESGWVLPAD